MRDLFYLGKEIHSVGFIGLGKSNSALAAYIKKNYPNISLALREDNGIKPEKGISVFDNIYIGSGARDNFFEDVLFLSPTVRRDSKELLSAASRGIILSSDIEFFFERDARPPLGVTGSDGKSTVTYISAELLTVSGIPAMPCGNYGIPLADVLDDDRLPVVELSSFGLMYTRPRTSRSVITNITRNHLNWHKDYREYIWAKLNIAENSDGLIFDYDSPDLRAAVCGREAYAVFSVALPYSALRHSTPAEHYFTLSGDNILCDGEKYISLKSATRREMYNIKNYMASLALTHGQHNRESAEFVINGFTGLPHRAKVIRELNGIKFIDASIDTSPNRSINTLSHIWGKIVIILTGRSKGESIEPLAELIKKKCKGAVLLGEITKEAEATLTDFTTMTADSMAEAVNFAIKLLSGQGTVLLSPGATSFDLYSSFEERADAFASAVNKL